MHIDGQPIEQRSWYEAKTKRPSELWCGGAQLAVRGRGEDLLWLAVVAKEKGPLSGTSGRPIEIHFRAHKDGPYGLVVWYCFDGTITVDLGARTVVDDTDTSA